MPGTDADDLDQLIRRALDLADREADERWQLVGRVHQRTDRAAFHAACRLATSTDLTERVLGLDILGQIGYPANRPYLTETLPIVVAAGADDRPEVLCAAIAALGHLADPGGLAVVLRHRAHPDSGVRFRVAAALPGVAGDPPAPDAVEALVGLTGDADPEVRDWATFGLGSQLDVDSRIVRDALAARLSDPDGDTAGEALVGLARRRDPRTLAPLLAWLDRDPGNLVVEAAAELGAGEALPALVRLKAAGWADGNPRPSILDEAIRSCSAAGEAQRAARR